MSRAHRRSLRKLNALHAWCRAVGRVVSKEWDARERARRAANPPTNRVAKLMYDALDTLPPARVTISPKPEAKAAAWRG